MTPLTRRALLVRGSAAAAAAGIAGRWSPGHGPASASAGYGALRDERRRHYDDLVAAVVALEGGRPDGGYVSSATAAFSGWYSRNPGLRPMADLVLDEVAAAGGARRLLTDADADADAGSDAHFGTRGNRRRVLAGEAFLLARPPYAPDRA
ncbi:MAG: hypothetical protein M3356_05745 [Actinomycetota bacterium]|nr:hypothetical protein [Actinomycetota bacterium]